MWDKMHFEQLQERRKQSKACGGEQRVEKQHQKGKLTARERIELLLDKDSFSEIGAFRKSFSFSDDFLGDGVVTGFGTVNGKKVYVSAQDFTYHGGTLGKVHAEKICHIMDMAIENKCPFISINDSGGARIEEGVISLNGYAGIFKKNMSASGLIPQIAVILGPCAGGACYSPAICDFIFMTRENSRMFITGPDVVKATTGESISIDELGGADIHSKKSGVSHFLYDNEEDCLSAVRDLLGYLPSSCFEMPPTVNGEPVDNTEQLPSIVPDQMRKSYDIKNVINTFIDADSFFEVSKQFAENIVVGFSRINGKTTGIIANQPLSMAGVLDSDASDKAARFVRFCDCFNIPILTLVDVPGYLPGKTQEYNGIIRHGAKLLYAFSEATVPKVSLIVRKAFGGAYIAMNSKGLGADIVFSWPIAQLAVMGTDGAVDILYKKVIQSSENPSETRKQLTEQYEKEQLNPYIAVENGFIDEIILPQETKQKIVRAFESLSNTKLTTLQKKHGNIPL